MPAGNVIRIADLLREGRIKSLIKQLSNTDVRFERRMICARLDLELQVADANEVLFFEQEMAVAQ